MSAARRPGCFLVCAAENLQPARCVNSLKVLSLGMRYTVAKPSGSGPSVGGSWVTCRPSDSTALKLLRPSVRVWGSLALGEPTTQTSHPTEPKPRASVRLWLPGGHGFLAAAGHRVLEPALWSQFSLSLPTR